MNRHDSSAPPDEQNRAWFPPLARRLLWADNPMAVQRLIKGLSVLCGILLLADLVVHRHAKVPGEGLWGFHAIAGFVSFALIVLAAGKLRTFIGRSESYYAPQAVDTEAYPPEELDVRPHNPDVGTGGSSRP